MPTNTSQDEVKICRDCKQEIEYLGEFPGPRCLACHAAKYDRELALTGKMPKPNFRKAVQS
jgi:hypothetical protein